MSSECHIFHIHQLSNIGPISESRIGGEIFIDIETVGRAPPCKEPQPARYQIVSVDDPWRPPTSSIILHRIVLTAKRINSVRNAGGNFFDDHQSLVSFLSQRLTLAETQALHFLMNRSGCNYTAQATSVNLKMNSVRATRARTINRANRLSPCSVKVTFFHHVAIVIYSRKPFSHFFFYLHGVVFLRPIKPSLMTS